MKHFVKSSLGGVCALVLAGAVGAAAAQGTQYYVTDLSLPGDPYTSGLGINSAGQVTGYGFTADFASYYAFVYSAGSTTRIVPSAEGTAINDRGQVSGFNNLGRAFTYHGGTVTDLGTLGGPYIFSAAYGLNNVGEVTGTSFTSGYSSSRPFIFGASGMSDLGTLGGSFGVGYGINDKGQVTGDSSLADNTANHAFVTEGGVMRDLGTLGGLESFGRAINEDGVVTGAANTPEHLHAFRYDDGRMVDLGTLGGASSQGLAIDRLGRVVGTADLESGEARAFMYDDGIMIDLDSRLESRASAAWTLISATGINAAGQIVANGYSKDGLC